MYESHIMFTDLVVVNDFFFMLFLCSARLGLFGTPCPHPFISHIQHSYLYYSLFITSAVNENHFSGGKFRELSIM